MNNSCFLELESFEYVYQMNEECEYFEEWIFSFSSPSSGKAGILTLSKACLVF